PPVHLGWRQYRTLGAAALDICAVADGTLDAYIDCNEAHGVWDYLGAMLICEEAGAVLGEVHDRELVVRSHAERRGPVAAATPELLGEALAARRAAGSRQVAR
ncbi:MAG: putative inositol monophosphatase, partial [Acidimicrobiaceae bacterium]|nr:putative inositol monophosphatase [Acidimicrobiaceae bacterium]